MPGLSVILAILSLITALVPLADHGLQFIDHRRQQHQQQQSQPPVLVTANKPVLDNVPPTPPEAGQRNVVFHSGSWWKFENGQWLVWTNRPQQMAQGGYPGVVR